MDLFFDVFSTIAVAYAIATGLAFGSTFLLWMSLKYTPAVALTSRKLGFLAAGATALAGTLFFAGQIVQAVATDPSWPRALARGALWEVFSIAIGCGLGFAHGFAERKR